VPFEFDYSDKLRAIVAKLRQRDPKRSTILQNKIVQIVQSDEVTIEHYKNLRSPLQHLKRVHIDSNFVLTFRYDKAKKLILFVNFDHHDHIYKT